MELLKHGDSVGIVACSNGLDRKNNIIMKKLEETLSILGLQTIFSNNLYRTKSIFNGSNKEKAEILMDFFKNPNIKAIFDVSGGDLANGILDYLDFEIIKKNPKLFFGYSDLTVVLNAIYAKTGMKTCLYQIRNIIDENKDIQINNFKNTFINMKTNKEYNEITTVENKKSLLNFDYKWIQGNHMEGIVVGGNLRCLLKLAGTKYMPDFENKILFLESMGGDIPKISTYLTQYKQMDILKKVKGIILGSYTEMEKENYEPNIIELVMEVIDDDCMPIIKTNEVGHGKDSKCIIIGSDISIF
ncbi:S66 family peptidase [Clostridium saccharobutylicum]|uniref:Microcin C7 self-immunity protein MccF n=1 Tax=Clostridium saccharobutylicum TaxID=169679 RepID=A0A1S8MYI0_CLOSA|nr:S66 peptidase family protein [Clostridium saccharobutylicum]OOM09269.1 microcin C7 self-immunity protein MccF [Clostridium saccharobutylicum]